MNPFWENSINKFIELSNKHNVRMLMIGGGAVNFHGYQRHSADVDFWIDVTTENLKNLILVFNEMGYAIEHFPDEVIHKKQNISIKFSPIDIDLELITNFSLKKSFDQAYQESEEGFINNQKRLKWNVLSLDDLIESKIRAGRNKDLLDILELKRINQNE